MSGQVGLSQVLSTKGATLNSACWRIGTISYFGTLVVQLCISRYGPSSVKYLMVITRAMYTQQTTARKLEKDGTKTVIDKTLGEEWL